jgi:predicted regulator of Ras-like GTPase activity (Roadblock/LC7/MglB family)
MSEAQQMLKNKLDELTQVKGIKHSNLITLDGLLLASDRFQNGKAKNQNQQLAALSANILAMATKNIKIIDQKYSLKGIKIEAKFSPDQSLDLTILITKIDTNVLLMTVYASEINQGLVMYEIEDAISKIRKIIQDTDLTEEFLKIGSIT